MDYDTLDLIADVYSHFLLPLSAIALILIQCIRAAYCLKYQLLKLFIYLIYVYLVLAVDLVFNIWPAIGLDYSTHTAFSLVFVVLITEMNRPAGLATSASYIGYLWLMVYLEFHTVADIVTTIIIVLPALFILRFLITSHLQRSD